MRSTGSPLPQALKRTFEAGQLPHALLIIGGDTSVKASLVSSVAAQFEITPADTLRLVGTPAIRELRLVIEKLHLRPHSSQRSLLVLEAIDQWSEQLATVLLKTIEEPPAHAHVILFAEHDEGLLPTIRSRVATFRLPHHYQPIEIESVEQLQQQPLSETFARTKRLVESQAPSDILRTWVYQITDRQQQRTLLEQLARIGSHPVNKRIALDAALLAQQKER